MWIESCLLATEEEMMGWGDFLHYAEETQDLGGATVVRKISRNWFNEEVRRSKLSDMIVAFIDKFLRA